jgi:hypothetical protein
MLVTLLVSQLAKEPENDAPKKVSVMSTTLDVFHLLKSPSNADRANVRRSEVTPDTSQLLMEVAVAPSIIWLSSNKEDKSVTPGGNAEGKRSCV